MALHQSDNLLAISDNAISIINKSLSSHIKQIQLDCKESIEQHIKKEMTLYYGVVNGNNHPAFSDIIMNSRDSNYTTDLLKFTETQLYYTRTQNDSQICIDQKSELYDINIPCIRLVIEYFRMIIHYGDVRVNTLTNMTVIRHIYDGFCKFVKEVNDNPLKYINVNSDLLNDFRKQYDESKEDELKLDAEYAEILQKKDEISTLKKQLDLEKKELQDYKNIKEEIEKCAKLKKHLIAFKSDLKKQKQQYKNDRKQFVAEQKSLSSINLDDELGECPE